MNTFLDTVAASLHAEFKGNLSDVTIVFPNKRASLFFNRALATFQTPVWSPRYVTISELFRSCSPDIELADHIDLIITLYKVYCNITGSEESLDQFYGWGEMMLADFDDIDNHMADGNALDSTSVMSVASGCSALNSSRRYFGWLNISAKT